MLPAIMNKKSVCLASLIHEIINSNKFRVQKLCNAPDSCG